MDNLIQEYKATLRKVRKAKESATDKADRELLSGMASDIEFALEWMTTGRRPGNRRGVERLAAYQRERPVDPIHIQRYVAQSLYEQEQYTFSDRDMERLKKALSLLTDREREIYLMSRGNCLSYAEIATNLCIAKSTVQDTIERAERKIQNRLR